MYRHFFGLRENPFNVNPDPRYLFLTPQTRLALDELKYGIQARKGLILLTGEVGTGKTTLINRLLDQFGEQHTPTAFIFNSHLEISHLFDFILADFGVPPDSGSNNNALMRLNQWLLERYRAGETPVLVVDEAQGLPTRVLEEIRMLLNLETPREKLLQIVLVGQPELEARIKRPELRQIKQRVALRCKTAPLDLSETHDYIQTRLEIAGANGKPVFAPQAIDAVYFYSRGIPRVINLLCENALINAYEIHVQPVPVHIVVKIAYKFQFDDIQPIAPPRDDLNPLDFPLIVAQSRSVDLLASLPAAPDRSCKEHTEVTASPVSLPPVVPHHHPSSVKEPAMPGAGCEKVSVLDRDSEPPSPTDIPVTPPPAFHQAPMATSRASELGEFFHEVGIQFFSGSATKATPPALPSSPAMVGENGKADSLPDSSHGQLSDPREPTSSRTKVDVTMSSALRAGVMRSITVGLILDHLSRWKDRQMSTLVLPARVLLTAIVVQRMKRSPQRLRALYRRCLALKDRCLHFVGSLDRSPLAASVYRWLRQPWNPNPWRLPESRLLELLRRSSHKKV
jgi:type II secretory pathway predicted ATPase ExeA